MSVIIALRARVEIYAKAGWPDRVLSSMRDPVSRNKVKAHKRKVFHAHFWPSYTCAHSHRKTNIKHTDMRIHAQTHTNKLIE